MTPTRRTRKPGPKKSKLNRNVTESSEEESSDAGSVTRCICGEAHNLGLMVQCDKCEVWQHCECIGLIQEKLPDHYYCDQCQPENHQLIKTSSGRSKRLYNASVGLANNVSPWLLTNGSNSADSIEDSKKPTKRRKTAQRTRPARNSSSPNQQSTSESSSSPTTTINSPTTNTDSLLLVEKIGNEQDKSILISPPPPSSSPLAKSTVIADEVNNGSDAESLFVIEERLTRSRRTTTKSAAAAAADNNREDSQDIIEEATTTPQRKKVKQRTVSSSPTPHESSKRAANSKHNNHSNKSIPQQQQVLFMDDFGSPVSVSAPSPYWNYTDGKPTRESSPAKVKYPHSKMSFSDMNRRAKQIMDCISKIQVEELKKPVVESPSAESDLINNQKYMLSRPRSLSTSSSTSSLSSASTVPLLDDYATTTSSASSPSTPIPFIPKHEETSIEILERVNRELTKFQRKFGIVYQQQPHHYLRGANQSSPQSSLGQTNGRLVSNSSNNTTNKK